MAQRKTATKTVKSRSSSKKKSTKTSSRKTKPSTSKRSTKSGSKSTRGAEVTIDRRRAGRRNDDGNETNESPVLAAPKLERRKKVNRRRQIDPTTCERDYSDDEIQFMNALEAYKRASGRMFPTCSEVLEVVRTLGYVRLASAETKAYEAPALAIASADAQADLPSTETNPSP